MSGRAGTYLFFVFFLFLPAGCATSASTANHAATGGIIRTFGEREFEPTRIHQTVYRMMEECTGRDGDLEAIHWTVALWLDSPARRAALRGGWHRDGEHREILLYEEFVFDAETISHEVLHDLYDGEVPLDVADRCMLDGEMLGLDDPRERPGRRDRSRADTANNGGSLP